MAEKFTGNGEQPSTSLLKDAIGYSNVKVIHKFGRNPDVDKSTTPEDVWEYGGEYTYPTTAAINYISSDDNTDNQIITVEGLDADWNEQKITITLNGQTKTQIGTGETWIRVFRAYNSDSTKFAGTIYLYEDDTIISGVPQTTTKVKATIDTLHQQTFLAMYSIPSGFTGYIDNIVISVNRGSSSGTKEADISMCVREFGGVFRSKNMMGLSNVGKKVIYALRYSMYPQTIQMYQHCLHSF